jgi:NAD(P)H-dependent FMN reductase
MKPTIITLSGSARRGSLNKKVARHAATEAVLQGVDSLFIDLAEYPLPIYDGDLEDSQGIPANALALGSIIDAADGLLIASPEYNGAYTALLKNTIDWLSRIDRAILAKPVAIASASPGRNGGAGGLRILRTTLEHMRVPVVDHELSIPHADEAFDVDGTPDRETGEAIHRIIAALIRHSRSATASTRAVLPRHRPERPGRRRIPQSSCAGISRS